MKIDNVETTSKTHRMNRLVLKLFPEQEVDWERYAEQYDAVTSELKPDYQEIMKMPLEGELEHLLKYNNAELICDLGAGTGNLSIPLATKYPDLKVVHIDFDPTYNNIARSKAEKAGINNMDFHLADAEDVRKIQELYGKRFKIILMVHALYAMRSKDDMDKPDRVLKAAYDSLADDGRLCIIDIEREMNLGFLIWDGLNNARKQKGGIIGALKFFKEMDQAKHQNANIIRNQRNGTYITQPLEGLVKMVKNAGFKNILYTSDQYYHGYDNIVVAGK